MPTRPRSLCLLTLLLLGSLPAPGEASSQGTHFILEARAGVAQLLGQPLLLGREVSPGIPFWGLTFGVGGRPANMRTRFYLVLDLDQTWNDRDEQDLEAPSLGAMTVGVRALYPLGRGVRLFTDLGAGPAWERRISTDFVGVWSHQEVSWVWRGGAGVAWRLVPSSSLFLRGQLLAPLVEPSPPPPSDAWKIRLGLAGGVTLHF